MYHAFEHAVTDKCACCCVPHGKSEDMMHRECAELSQARLYQRDGVVLLYFCVWQVICATDVVGCWAPLYHYCMSRLLYHYCFHMYGHDVIAEVDNCMMRE